MSDQPKMQRIFPRALHLGLALQTVEELAFLLDSSQFLPTVSPQQLALKPLSIRLFCQWVPTYQESFISHHQLLKNSLKEETANLLQPPLLGECVLEQMGSRLGELAKNLHGPLEQNFKNLTELWSSTLITEWFQTPQVITNTESQEEHSISPSQILVQLQRQLAGMRQRVADELEVAFLMPLAGSLPQMPSTSSPLPLGLPSKDGSPLLEN